MRIVALVENMTRDENLGVEHGLSLWIEARGKKILFDTGGSFLFADNAKKLGLDLSEIDMAVLSHGHYDHGGGLEKFFEINTKAKVYIHPKAVLDYYAVREGTETSYIGIPENVKNSDRFVFAPEEVAYNSGDMSQGSMEEDYNQVSAWTKIGEGLELLTGVKKVYPQPESNQGLCVLCNGQVVQDKFVHEQSLFIEENGVTTLITGCAHNGILNILTQFKHDKGFEPDYVIGGFHLTGKGNRSLPGLLPSDSEMDGTQVNVSAYVDNLGEELIKFKSKFYTCHCTGVQAYIALKASLGGQVDYMFTGRDLLL